MASLQELRPLLRDEPAPAGTVLLARGGPDTTDRLLTDARRTARRFSLDGQPLLGISVAAALDMPLEELGARTPFSRFASIYSPAVTEMEGFQLVPTFGRPHFTVRLQLADETELRQLLAALGSLRPTRRMVNVRAGMFNVQSCMDG
jgi:hypothetical protein